MYSGCVIVNKTETLHSNIPNENDSSLQICFWPFEVTSQVGDTAPLTRLQNIPFLSVFFRAGAEDFVIVRWGHRQLLEDKVRYNPGRVLRGNWFLAKI